MRFLILPCLALSLLLTGCTPSECVPKEMTVRRLPSASAEPPVLDVYLTDANAVVSMDAEEYTTGVVAGEMPGDWPLEALKAQAILARTFVLKFITEKQSMYDGADISTDIREAQAWNAEAVNDRIREAVRETSGLVLLTESGGLPYPWFHAHSGGATSLAADGIDWQGKEPSYTKSTAGLDSPEAPADVQAWSAEFTEQEFISACRDAGYRVTSARNVTIGRQDAAGRAVTLLADGTSINAARLRISLGSTKMRSAMLTSLAAEDGMIRMSGRGYGHGVGMPQWGAYALARDGYPAEEIATYYYEGLSVVRVW